MRVPALSFFDILTDDYVGISANTIVATSIINSSNLFDILAID